MNVDTTNAVVAAKVLAAFLVPFDKTEVKRKPAMVKGNRCLVLHYIDARCVMEKLDEVVGIENWRDEYTLLPQGSVECRLSVRIAGEWITKSDVGSESEQPDHGDRMKSAYSDAFKRAAVKFGIGRHLYRLAQVWADYDPVKKQIIGNTLPEERKAPAKPAAVPQKPVANNPHGRMQLAEAYAKCENRVQANEVDKRVKYARDNGTISEEDVAALRPVQSDTYSRLPK